MSDPHSSEAKRLQKGKEILESVYSPEIAEAASASDRPLSHETVAHLFGEIWSRPNLSIRDRRLLVLGATAMLGRSDLVEAQVMGALRSGDLDEDQLDEAALQLAFYIGWGNATALHKGITDATTKHKAHQDND